jgi:hypothetical protein
LGNGAEVCWSGEQFVMNFSDGPGGARSFNLIEFISIVESRSMIRKSHTCLSILIATAILASCASPAKRHKQQRPASPGAQIVKPAALLFAGFDHDSDYVVSRDEFEVGLIGAFAIADEDASGRLSLFEYRAWATRALGSETALPGWISVDRNNNSSIEEAEFHAEFGRLAELYGILEGGIVLAELTRDMPILSAPRASGSGGGKGSGGRGGKGGGGGRRGLQ